MPLDLFIKFMSYFGFSLNKIYKKLSKLDIKFGMGGTEVKLPLKISEDMINLASCMTPTTDAVLVRKRYPGKLLTKMKVKKLIEKIEKRFKIKVIKTSKRDLLILSKPLSKFLQTFFIYGYPWKMSIEEISKTTKIWKSIWN